jgi:hypothetical protein
MFDLGLVDTLRLGFGQVVHHHRSHADAAASALRWGRRLRAGETILLTAVAMSSVAAAFGKGQAYSIASAAMAAVALLLFLIHAVFDVDDAARAHLACSTRLWHMREQYRALLSDINDGAIGHDAARARRNTLMEELGAIYEAAPALPRRVFKIRRTEEGAEELALTDQEIDRFLPQSLHMRRQTKEPAPQEPAPEEHAPQPAGGRSA